MELPTNLKELYRHWEGHVGGADGAETNNAETYNGGGNKELLRQIRWFINERLEIWKKKTAGEKLPYTKDAILSQYRFCNIFREFDRQTIEFHTLLNPLRDDFPLWLLNMFYCRMVARPETIRTAGLLSFDATRNKEFYARLMSSPRPRYGTPYVFPVSVIQRSATPTRELFITNYLPHIMQSIAKEITTWKKESVYNGLEKIIPIFGYNLRFLWTEVLIDVAYQFPQYVDLFARFPVGPGALPTLKRFDAKKDPSELVRELARIHLDTHLTYNGKLLRLSAENWEGVACEFRKYTSLAAGKGRKRIFRQR